MKVSEAVLGMRLIYDVILHDDSSILSHFCLWYLVLFRLKLTLHPVPFYTRKVLNEICTIALFTSYKHSHVVTRYLYLKWRLETESVSLSFTYSLSLSV